MRHDGREPDELRPITFQRDFTTQADGSVLVSAGNTMVLCTASVDEGVPRWMKGSGKGWVTAEYGMLPRSTHTRSGRAPGGRGQEIQRLIGRSLRAAIEVGDGTFVVGWVGRMTGVKDTNAVLEIVRATRARGVDAVLCMVGDGPDRERLALRFERFVAA